MKRTWTIIGVGDVPASLKWYQALFGQPATLPAHDYFGQILDFRWDCLALPPRVGRPLRRSAASGEWIRASISSTNSDGHNPEFTSRQCVARFRPCFFEK